MEDKEVNTSGGASIGKDVTTSSGDFIGRDRTSTETTSKTITIDGGTIATIVALVVVGIMGTVAIIRNINLPSPTPTPTELSTPVNTSALTPTNISIPLFADGFEENLNSWQGSSTPINAALVTPGYNDSKSAVQVQFDGGNAGIYRKIPGTFTSGNTYRASVRCKAEVNATCLLWFGDMDNIDSLAYENDEQTDKIQGTGEWIQLSICNTPTKDEIMYIYVYSQTQNSKAVYDDLRVERVSQC